MKRLVPVGAAAYFGDQGIFWATLVPLVAGALLVYVSELLADAIEDALPAGRTSSASRPSTTTA